MTQGDLDGGRVRGAGWWGGTIAACLLSVVFPLWRI